MEITTIATGMTGAARGADHGRAFRVLGSPYAVTRPRGGWCVTGLGGAEQATRVALPTVGFPVDHNSRGVSVPRGPLCRERT